MSKKITDEIRLKMVEMYEKEKKSTIEIAKLLCFSHSTVSLYLKKSGVTIDSSRYRKYTLHENYFDIIDTEEKAYFLGFLYADGYNSESKNSFILTLQERDKEILERLAKEIGSDKPLSYVSYDNCEYPNDYHRQNQYRLIINSGHISRKLKELGCYQNKSFTLKFPTENQVPINLIRHFMRGYFDGDGSISFHYTKNKRRFGKLMVNCSLVSSVDFCNSCSIMIKNILNLNAYIKKSKKIHSSINVIYIGGNQQIRVFLDWLYKDSKIHLKRKYDKYLEIFGLYKNLGLDKPNMIPQHWKRNNEDGTLRVENVELL